MEPIVFEFEISSELEVFSFNFKIVVFDGLPFGHFGQTIFIRCFFSIIYRNMSI